MLGIDDINRLEQENEQLKKEAALNAVCIANYIKKVRKQDKLIAKIQNDFNNRKPAAQYIKALKEIQKLASPHCSQCIEILKIINEVLNV